MAVEVEPGKEAEATMTSPAETVPAKAAMPPAAGSWSWTMLGMAGAAVLLTLAGVFALSNPLPNTVALGLGLTLWGLLDLVAQRRGLVAWKGPQAAVGNVVNLARALALLAMGVWLLMIATGQARPTHSAVIISMGVFLVGLYLAATLTMGILVKGVRLGGQAYLLAALLLMLFSYYYFCIPFTYAWAAVFAFLSFAAAAWSIKEGVLAETLFLGLAVLLAVLLLGAPLVTYTYQQAYEVEEQPLFTPTLLIPRMRQVVADLSGDAGQIRWAPVHTQPGQPGDVLFSDKIAFVDTVHGRECVKLFQQHEDGLREILRVGTGAGVNLSAFSDDGSRLAYTGPSSAPSSKAPALYILEPLSAADDVPGSGQAPAARTPFSFRHFFAWLEDATASDTGADAGPDTSSLAYGSRRIHAGVAPEPDHGQVWRSLGKELYFSAPPGGPQNQDSAILRADLNGRGADTIIPGRALPAVSPDGKSLLSVGFIPDKSDLEIADENSVDGQLVPSGFRPFVPPNEAAYFPAWNEKQTEVLFLDPRTGRLMAMNSNGRNHRLFDPRTLDSNLWRSEKLVPFLLQRQETGSRFRIYRSRPDGTKDKLVYETEGQEISAPQWSADGARIAFIIRNGEKSEVVTVGSDGTWPRHFFTTQDALDELKWSPDGLKVAWICRRAGGAQEIWTAGYEGLDPVLVHSDDGELQDLTWSPRGKHLAVQQTLDWTFLGLRLVKPALQNVLMVNLLDNRARVMTRYGILSHDPAFSPHGDAIAYFTDQNTWKIDPRGARKSALVISQLY